MGELSIVNIIRHKIRVISFRDVCGYQNGFIFNMIFSDKRGGGGGGLKAIWNFSQNSSVLVAASIC